jgi:hypothetical protein
MKGIKVMIFVICMVFSLVSFAATAEFKAYPGSKLDETLTKDAAEVAAKAKLAMKPSIYVTNDSFEKVLDFYKGIGKEYQTPLQKEARLQVLPSGKKPKEAFIIFDGANTIWVSKLWAKIQRPYVGQKMEEGPDMTYISVSDKR